MKKIDAEMAYEILVFALFKEVKRAKREKRTKLDANPDEENSSEDDISELEEKDVDARETSTALGSRKQLKRKSFR
jgi:DNA replication licensing factor MCM3